MTTRLLAPALLLTLLAPDASAGPGYWHVPGYWRDLECQWGQELPAIRSSLDASNALIAYPCDSQRQAAVAHQFRHLDDETLARYNRGVWTPLPRPGR